MSKRRLFGLLLLATCWAGTAAAQNTPSTRLSLKGLDAVAVQVEPIAAAAARDGLSADTIREQAVSRLRRAGIRVATEAQPGDPLRRPCLAITVATSKLETGEHLYSIRVELVQWVASLERPDLRVSAAVPVPASTWSAPNVFGIVPGPSLAGQMEAAVGRLVDQFTAALRLANPGKSPEAGPPGRAPRPE
jgi:hypothetical protein